jgi:hypothetical protein
VAENSDPLFAINLLLAFRLPNGHSPRENLELRIGGGYILFNATTVRISGRVEGILRRGVLGWCSLIGGSQSSKINLIIMKKILYFILNKVLLRIVLVLSGLILGIFLFIPLGIAHALNVLKKQDETQI